MHPHTGTMHSSTLTGQASVVDLLGLELEPLLRVLGEEAERVEAKVSRCVVGLDLVFLLQGCSNDVGLRIVLNAGCRPVNIHINKTNARHKHR